MRIPVVEGQLRRVVPVLLVTWVFAFGVLGIAVLLHLGAGIPVALLMRDPSTIAGIPFYSGAISNLGVLLWAAAVTTCLLTYRFLGKGGREGEVRSFFLFSGLLTILLCLDDLYLLHEEVFPFYLYLPEKFVLGGHVLLTSMYLVRFRRQILRTDFLLLVAALGMFGLSVGFDIIFELLGRGYQIEDGQRILGIGSELLSLGLLLEDGPKFIGIGTWLAYFVHTATQALYEVGKAPEPTRDMVST